MPGRFVVLAAAALLVTSGSAGAQKRWSAELDGGVALPTNRLAGADLATGVGFGANVRYRLQPHLSVYTGWAWHHFSTDAMLGVRDLDAEDTGYMLGLRFEHPFASERPSGNGLSYWLRAGGLANHIEVENSAGDIVSDTGHGLGYELGGGLTVPVGTRLSLTPGLQYRSLSRDIGLEARSRSGRLAYVMIGTGLAFSF